MVHRGHLPLCDGREHCACERNRYWILSVMSVILIGVLVVGGSLSHSLALWSEVGHAGVDLLAMMLSAYVAERVRGHHPVKQQKIRRRGATVSIFLLVATGVYIAYESWRRISQPVEVAGPETTVFAIVALSITIMQALFLHAGEERNETTESAFGHMLEDVGQNGIAIVAGALIWATGESSIDTIAGALVTLVVLGRVIKRVFFPKKISGRNTEEKHTHTHFH